MTDATDCDECGEPAPEGAELCPGCRDALEREANVIPTRGAVDAPPAHGNTTR